MTNPDPVMATANLSGTISIILRISTDTTENKFGRKVEEEEKPIFQASQYCLNHIKSHFAIFIGLLSIRNYSKSYSLQ